MSFPNVTFLQLSWTDPNTVLEQRFFLGGNQPWQQITFPPATTYFTTVQSRYPDQRFFRLVEQGSNPNTLAPPSESPPK